MTPTIRKSTSHEIGGCNNCNRAMTPKGETVHVVYQISFNSITVRCCEQCMALLGIAMDIALGKA